MIRLQDLRCLSEIEQERLLTRLKKFNILREARLARDLLNHTTATRNSKEKARYIRCAKAWLARIIESVSDKNW